MFGVVEEVKVGVKSQVVIPLRIRQEAEVRPGDILLMTSDRNGRISIMKKPKNWALAAYGCCQDAWGNNPLEYLEKEREKAWG
ncbi:MAG: AbrB/MazE/SpoVT family DNA-binding domain-containing protein [Syntrophomonadaceae bacterium]|nr:AbrB/MazE/SpoVT family DNA-binding domain-containing protein [Syntrophomonadaceae bacterium]MDD3023093.1 AbrB/MazE/SpoVT family DNA-binding domain-containing protein [Syntrophomonadaceae bacterium]